MKMAAFAALFFLQMGMLQAQDEKAIELPSIQLPSDLQAYADFNDVAASLAAVLDVLATAKFEKAAYGTKEDEPPCDALNRAMMLTHAGFNMLINARERGMISPGSVLPRYGDVRPIKGLISERRGLLLRIWDMPKFEKLFQLRQKLSAWPKNLREDVVIFLTELQRFRITRKEMLLRFPDRVAEIQRRETIEYAYHYKSDWKLGNILPGSKEEVEFLLRWPKPLGYAAHSAALYDVMKEIPQQERPIDACLKETAGTRITFSGDVAAFNSSYSYPIRYMFTFWERRESEGLSTVASFAIASAIEALR